MSLDPCSPCVVPLSAPSDRKPLATCFFSPYKGSEFTTGLLIHESFGGHLYSSLVCQHVWCYVRFSSNVSSLGTQGLFDFFLNTLAPIKPVRLCFISRHLEETKTCSQCVSTFSGCLTSIRKCVALLHSAALFHRHCRSLFSSHLHSHQKKKGNHLSHFELKGVVFSHV